MRKLISSLRTDCRAAAAAEMALISPFLAVLMFGSMEMGKYFLDAHIVQKAVRDGARFAARQSFTGMPCGGTATNDSAIKNLVRTGTTASGGTARLSYWTSNSTITIQIECDTTTTYANKGLYTAVTGGARRVTVIAAVPYVSLLGMNYGGTELNARSQSAVMGI